MMMAVMTKKKNYEKKGDDNRNESGEKVEMINDDGKLTAE